LVVAVTKPECDPSDVFDDPVVAFAAGVGQAGVDGGDDRLLPGVDGGGQGVDLGDLAGGGEGVERVQRGADLVAQPAAVLAGQHLAQKFFGDPRGDEITGGVEGVELSEHLAALLVGEAFHAAEQPAAAGPLRVTCSRITIVNMPTTEGNLSMASIYRVTDSSTL